MSGSLTLTGARLFDGERLRDGLAVRIADGRIAGLVAEDGLAGGFASGGSGSARAVALGGGILCPGFVDVQVNGGGGVLFNDAPDIATLRRMAQAHAGLGATTILPTLISDTPGRTAAAVAAVEAALAERVPGIGGLHLEGPHLAPARKGAHDPARLRPMGDADLDLLLAAARRLPVLVVTLAPEAVRPDQIAALSGAGVIVSLGHSDCSHAQAQAAFDAGARMVTHLFNAMSQMTSRAPGLVGAALDAPGVTAGLIADLVHVSAPTLRVTLAADAARGGLFLVSDAMSPAGSDLAEFTLTGQRVTRQAGTLRLDDGTLAGADLDLARAVRNVVALGVPVERALAMATLRPARAVGLPSGRIHPGAVADLVHLDDDLHLQAVWQSGRPVLLSDRKGV